MYQHCSDVSSSAKTGPFVFDPSKISSRTWYVLTDISASVAQKKKKKLKKYVGHHRILDIPQ